MGASEFPVDLRCCSFETYFPNITPAPLADGAWMPWSSKSSLSVAVALGMYKKLMIQKFGQPS